MADILGRRGTCCCAVALCTAASASSVTTFILESVATIAAVAIAAEAATAAALRWSAAESAIGGGGRHAFTGGGGVRATTVGVVRVNDDLGLVVFVGREPNGTRLCVRRAKAVLTCAWGRGGRGIAAGEISSAHQRSQQLGESAGRRGGQARRAKEQRSGGRASRGQSDKVRRDKET